MNFLHILRRFVFIFLAFQCWSIGGFVLAASHFQEFGQPYVQTYLPGTFTYVNHFNSIAQGEEGFIYVGARNGILRFNGRDWKHIASKGDLHLVKHQDRIFAYNKNGVFLLSRSANGEPELMDGIAALTGEQDLPAQGNTRQQAGLLDGSILEVISHRDNLYILTSEGSYILGKDTLTRFTPGIVPLRIFPSGDAIRILSRENGLFQFQADQLKEVQIPRGMVQISQILAFDTKAVFIDGINNKLIVSGPGDSVLELRQAEKFLEEYDFTCTAKLSDDHIAIGTRKGGVFIITADGDLIYHITAVSGLYGNEILNLLADQAGNLWALHEHALSRIEIPSAFSYFCPDNGLDGNVMDILRHEGVLYAATSRGLFRLQAGDDPQIPSFERAQFIQVPGIKEDCRCLANTSASLLVGGRGGLYELSSGNVRQILRNPVNALFCDVQHNVLFAGTETGIRIFSLNDWKEIQNFSIPDICIDNIAISESGFLWLSSRSGAFYRSTKPFSNAQNLSYTSYASEDLQSIDGSYVDMISTPGHLYFSSFKGLFTFDPAANQFLRDSSFRFSLPQGSYRIRQVEPDARKNLWLSIDHPDNKTDKIWQAIRNTDGVYEMHPLLFRRVNPMIINSLFAEQDEVLWIGTNKGIVRFDALAVHPENPVSQTYISGLSIGNGPLLPYDRLVSRAFQETLKKGRMDIPYSRNSIRFEFLSTQYNCESLPLFQYRLDGLDEKWSDWNSNSFVEFRELSHGKYEFFVRSQDIYGTIYGAGSFPFRISAPIYKSWYALLIYLFLVLVMVYFIQKWTNLKQLREQYHLEEVVQERTESLVKEKEKTEDLLANILPKTTADELKDTGKATSSKFKMVTVLFADIQGFTKIAEEMNPDKLIDQLDKFYFHFDSVMEKYNIEKIKTIGDAYMAAGGIPIKNCTNPVEVVLAALEMQQYMKELKKTKADIWDLRIGVHTGSVIAGVVGQKKYSYDIWGDTVNTASRMESSGEVGKVNISATTYKLIKDFFQCEFRGKMPVKYKGDIAMFFVNGLNPTFTEADRVTPNAKLFIQLQLLRLLDVEEFIMNKLEKELPQDLLFHNAEHTSHVYTQVELLGRGEKINEEDLLLLRTAALLHDIGYIDQMDDHEARSVEYAREILLLYRYKEKQIERICELILATAIPSDPKNLLEQIICDANLDHLGRVDFLIQSDKLFQEYRMRHKIKSKKDWNQFQINFLKTHEFYTSIAKKMCEVSKEQQIENILQFS